MATRIRLALPSQLWRHHAMNHGTNFKAMMSFQAGLLSASNGPTVTPSLLCFACGKDTVTGVTT